MKVASFDGMLDAQYANLRIWRDLNQDGVSQAGELQSQQSLGIDSIGVAGAPTNNNLGNGNTQIASGSFARTNGVTGQSWTAALTRCYLLTGNKRRYFINSCYRIILLICRPNQHETYLSTSKDHELGATCRTRYLRVRTN